ncbi:hypothetical protein QJS04_geneDACA015932 [Acorus gramineus]|uniref:Uncharacterized protein n=1 Tax=Acorus gramineus TaxID=55184 RepID=A0AAV9BEM7_ACOGR|nr:hypothetical protein QJS04_geneDACA015932 [Acorus gramineus]
MGVLVNESVVACNCPPGRPTDRRRRCPMELVLEIAHVRGIISILKRQDHETGLLGPFNSRVWEAAFKNKIRTPKEA